MGEGGECLRPERQCFSFLYLVFQVMMTIMKERECKLVQAIIEFIYRDVLSRSRSFAVEVYEYLV